MNNLVLAYLGDAVYELYIRKYLINKNISNVNDLQKESLKYVTAVNQRKHLERLINENMLTNEELEIVKRGRNMKNHSKRNTNIITYKWATGLECLIGFLEQNKQTERIEQIMSYIVGE